MPFREHNPIERCHWCGDKAPHRCRGCESPACEQHFGGDELCATCQSELDQRITHNQILRQAISDTRAANRKLPKHQREKLEDWYSYRGRAMLLGAVVGLPLGIALAPEEFLFFSIAGVFAGEVAARILYGRRFSAEKERRQFLAERKRAMLTPGSRDESDESDD